MILDDMDGIDQREIDEQAERLAGQLDTYEMEND